MQRIHIIDSHTGGEPTRVVLDGLPDLGRGSVAERAQRFAAEFDHYRRAIVCEPRGNDVLVGALLVAPQDAANSAGVIFFNNVGLLGMCGHGTIGLAATLAHLGRTGNGWTMKSSESTTSSGTLRPTLELVYSLPSTFDTWAVSLAVSLRQTTPHFPTQKMTALPTCSNTPLT